MWLGRKKQISAILQDHLSPSLCVRVSAAPEPVRWVWVLYYEAVKFPVGSKRMELGAQKPVALEEVKKCRLKRWTDTQGAWVSQLGGHHCTQGQDFRPQTPGAMCLDVH